MSEPAKALSLREKLLSLLKFKGAVSADEMSDVDLRQAISSALRETVPGFIGLESVFPGDSQVVYAVWVGENVHLFRCDYAVSEDGSISIGEEKEEVEPVTRYEVVGAEDQPEHECTCHKGERAMADAKKDLIGRVIANKTNPFEEADRKVLEGLSDEKLKTLADSVEKPEEEEEKKVEEPTSTPPAQPTTPPASPSEPSTLPAGANVVQVSAEELTSLRSLAADVKRREQDYRGGLIQKLKGAKTTYTDDELKALSTPVLEKTVTALGLVDRNERAAFDYSMRPLPVDTSADTVVPPPPDMAAAIRASRNRAAN